MRFLRAYGYIALPILAGLIVFALSLLVACAPADQAIAARPPAQLARPLKQVDVTPICGKVKEFTPAEEKALGEAVAALDENNPIIPAMGDYKRMREEARACAKF